MKYSFSYLGKRSSVSVEQNLHGFVENIESLFLGHLLVVLIRFAKQRRRHVSSIASGDYRVSVGCAKFVDSAHERLAVLQTCYDKIVPEWIELGTLIVKNSRQPAVQ